MSAATPLSRAALRGSIMAKSVLYRVGALVQAPTPWHLDVVRDAYVLQGADGRLRAVAPWSDRAADVGVDEALDLSDRVVTPAFADPHVHLPQFDVRGRGSAGLLDWLRDTIFPEELRFADAAHARAVSRRFYRALAHFGTLAAGVYLPQQEESARAAFEEGARSPLRLTMGKVMMDRNAPRALLDESAEAAVEASARLADEYHGRGRLRYAFAPRYAPACSNRLLALAGQAARSRGCAVETHLSETPDEVAWVERLFPNAPDYLAVYEGTGLSGPRTIFGHGIHLDASQWSRVSAAGAWVAHCPLSNEALASGRMPLERAPADANLCVATDVGASPSASVLDAMALARRLHPRDVATPARLLHMATTAGHKALGFGGEAGLVAPGHDASFLAWRLEAPVDRAFDATRWLDDLMRAAREAGPERVRPERVVARGEAL